MHCLSSPVINQKITVPAKKHENMSHPQEEKSVAPKRVQVLNQQKLLNQLQ